MSKTRIGIIGCGGMAKNHVERFEEIAEQIEVTAVIDLDLKMAEGVAEFLPNTPMMTRDYREALNVVDAMLVVLPHHLHKEVTIECLNAGKHVLCEKPLANTEEECLEMIEAAERNNRVLMVAYCMRFHPLVLKMKEYIDNKTFGECFQLFSHGCHYIDLMLWMMGKPVRGTHTGTNLCTPWMEREGTSNVVIEFEGGKLGYHFGTWGARGSKLKYAFHAHCEKGMIELDLEPGELRFYGDAEAHVPGVEVEQSVTVLFKADKAKPTNVAMKHFVECVKEGKKPLTDPLSSLDGLRVIWKLYEAEDNHEIANLEGLGLNNFL